jgi:pSer/pThr/pTyr-binding forkhead associated (FHA) protein
MQVKLVVVKGRPMGKEIPLPSTVFVIGRDAKCHLRPHCELVSQQHCAIARQGGRVVVRDLHSSNGTFVNDQRIQGQIAVKHGDTLRVGTLAFGFQISSDLNDSDPVQIIDEVEVGWLIESPSDSSVLNPCRQTMLVRTPPEELELAAGEGSKAVSAGEYLKDCLRKPRA